MSAFEPAIAVVLRHEGGWVDDPDDPGGETNFGISRRIIDREKLTPEELGLPSLNPGAMKLLKVETAVALYRQLFWEPYGYERLKNQEVATKLFDAGINMGPARAHVLAQQAAIVCGQWLIVDGVLGPKTVDCINACNSLSFLQAMADEMATYYRTISTRRPKLAKFLSNWLKRARWPALKLTGEK